VFDLTVLKRLSFKSTRGPWANFDLGYYPTAKLTTETIHIPYVWPTRLVTFPQTHFQLNSL